MTLLILSRLFIHRFITVAPRPRIHKELIAPFLARLHPVLLAILLCLVTTGQSNAQFAQQGTKLIGTGAVGRAQQGMSVSISSDGNTAIVGGYLDNQKIGAAWVFVRSGGVWTQQGSKLVGTGNVDSSCQGRSVSISSDGNTAIVGGISDDNSSGAAWVFVRSDGIWTQQGGKLVGTGAVGYAEQGTSISISSDGNTAIVGGQYDNGFGGAAWVFARSGETWTQQGGKLVGSGAASDAQQGHSVSISSDGNTAIVGGNGSGGAAWVWTRSGGVWSQQGAKLVGTGATGSAQQGASVSISSDGNTAIVGGVSDNGLQGAAWVWTRSGEIWTQQGSKLVGTGVVNYAIQGFSVALSSDGNTAIIGGYNDNGGIGAVWVWTRSGGIWTQQGTKLVGSGVVGASVQGYSVAISSDGNTAIIGGYNDDSGIGAAWIYTTAPLPVELTSFRVMGHHSNAELYWETATEINNYGFAIERRRIQRKDVTSQKEEAEWTQSGFVEGAGTSASPKDYTFIDMNLSASKYEFRLKQIDRNGALHYSQSVEVEIGVEPKVFRLSQNYPNPFNPSTEIRFSVATTARAMLSVYNLLGEQVAVVYDGIAEAGRFYTVKLNKLELSNGAYIYRLQSGSSVEAKKLILVK